ncbi:GYD domain-containing protein [Mesorhizobium huakuii]|nr:GYD domain-containing protein [Mesorhizobium huakuii]
MKVTILANYAPHAAKGLMQGSDRQAAVKALFESVGGKMTSVMFTRGIYDVVVNGEVPDQSAGIGMSLAVRASGSLTEMVVLEELDMKAVLAAAKRLPARTNPPADGLAFLIKAARFDAVLPNAGQGMFFRLSRRLEFKLVSSGGRLVQRAC